MKEKDVQPSDDKIHTPINVALIISYIALAVNFLSIVLLFISVDLTHYYDPAYNPNIPDYLQIPKYNASWGQVSSIALLVSIVAVFLAVVCGHLAFHDSNRIELQRTRSSSIVVLVLAYIFVLVEIGSVCHVFSVECAGGC
jgi:hypothetical protein